MQMFGRLQRGFYLPIAIGVLVLGAIFGALGVVLVYLGVKGQTAFQIFGQKLNTTDSGIAAIFLAVVLVVLLLRALLKSVDKNFNVA
jgi:hypothetical protein